MNLPSISGLQSRAQASIEMDRVHWLAEVANNPVPYGLIPDGFIGVCSNEDRRNRVSSVDQMSVQLNSSHARHLNVGDQAGGFRQETRGEEIGC